jgi:hypothetical protein
MPCVLRASIKDSESLERFLEVTTLPIVKVYRVGELGFRTIKGKRLRVKIPSVNIPVAGGGWDNLRRQFRGAKRFFERREPELRRLRRILHSSGWVLDFGVHGTGPNIAIEGRIVPVDMIQLAAVFGLKLELSIYKILEEDRRRTRRSTGRGITTRKR